jgi:hypothetical protein
MQEAERRRIAAAYARSYPDEPALEAWHSIETSNGQVTAAQPETAEGNGDMRRQLDPIGKFNVKEAIRASHAIRHGEDRIFKGVTVEGHEAYVEAQTDDLITAALGIAQHITPVAEAPKAAK